MAIINPTSFLGAAGNAYPAARLRRVMQTLNGDREGVIEPDGLTVTATSPASMNIQVAAGRAWVTGDAITRQGSYLVENDAAVTVGPLGAAHATLHRIDLVVLRVRDAAPDGGSDTVDEARLEVVQGSPAGSPVPPLVPGSAIPLAEIRIDAGVTSIAAGKVTDTRFPGSRHPRGRLAMVSDQMAPANTAVAMGWNSSPILRGGFTTAANALIVPRTGTYLLSAAMDVERATTTGFGVVDLNPTINGGGATVVHGTGILPPVCTNNVGTISTPIDLKAGDSVLCNAFWADTAGAAGYFKGSPSGHRTWFDLTWLGD